MGLIPADEVGDIMLSKNAKYLKSENNRVYFSSSEVRKMDFTEYLNKIGLKPRAKNTKDSYKVLTVILSNTTPAQADVDKVSNIVERFSREGSDGIDGIYNLYEATNGKLHLDVANISDSIK
jgi:hypothetical protein